MKRMYMLISTSADQIWPKRIWWCIRKFWRSSWIRGGKCRISFLVSSGLCWWCTEFQFYICCFYRSQNKSWICENNWNRSKSYWWPCWISELSFKCSWYCWWRYWWGSKSFRKSNKTRWKKRKISFSKLSYEKWELRFSRYAN